MFAFSNRLEVTAENDGWRVYNPEEEFSRQGVLSAGSGWRISHVNHEYSACESYPRKVGVPAGIRDWEIKKALEFRANGRFPIMVWKNPRGDRFLPHRVNHFSSCCYSAARLIASTCEPCSQQSSRRNAAGCYRFQRDLSLSATASGTFPDAE